MREGNSDVSLKTLICASQTNDYSVSKYSSITVNSGFIAGQIELSTSADYLNVGIVGEEEYTVLNGIIASSPENTIQLSGKALQSWNKLSFYSRTQGNNAHLTIMSALQYDIKVQAPMGGIAMDNTLANGYGMTYLYTLTSSHLAHFSYYDGNKPDAEWTLYLENNAVKVKAQDTAFDLQAELDKVAAAGTYTYDKPATITIPSEGVVIDKVITVDNKCHATLTGGPIIISNTINEASHEIFRLYGSIHLKNIVFDCNNNTDNIFNYYFSGSGKLYVDHDVTFKNNSITNTVSLFSMYEGSELEYWARESVFKSSLPVIEAYNECTIKMYGSIESGSTAIDAPKSKVTVFWGTVASAGNYVIRCKDITVTETGTTIKSLREDASSVVLIEAETARYITGEYIGEGSRIVVKKEAETYGYVALPTLKLETDATVKAMDRLQYPITLEGDWQNFTIGKGIMYCNAGDTEMVTFKEPYPSGINPLYYTPEGAFLFADLQWVIDHPMDNTGEDDKPIEITVGCEGVNLTDDILFQRLQAEIDGVAYEDECEEEDNIKLIDIKPVCNCDRVPVFPHVKIWHFNGNTTIAKGSCITLRNIYLDGLNGTKRIYVDGTLIIDVYVYFTRFYDYAIHIRPGGRVIWRGGWTETIEKVIYNEGGTISIEGGYIYDGEKGGNVIVNVDGTIDIHNDSDGVPTYVHGTIVNGDNGHNTGTITINEGSYEGGITNYGKLVIDGADINGLGDYGISNYGELYFNGGTSTGKDNVGIWSFTDFHLCGCANVGDIYLRGGSTIYITERLTVKIRIHIFIDGDFGEGAFIAIGTGGYVLTEEDLKLIELILPDGYEWEYDKTRFAIVIKSSTGINGVEMDDNTSPSDIYTLKGVKVGNTADKKNIPDGVYVVDGKKKTLKK